MPTRSNRGLLFGHSKLVLNEDDADKDLRRVVARYSPHLRRRMLFRIYAVGQTGYRRALYRRVETVYPAMEGYVAVVPRYYARYLVRALHAGYRLVRQNWIRLALGGGCVAGAVVSFIAGWAFPPRSRRQWLLRQLDSLCDDHLGWTSSYVACCRSDPRAVQAAEVSERYRSIPQQFERFSAPVDSSTGRSVFPCTLPFGIERTSSYGVSQWKYRTSI